jgi:DNA-binding transcriptional MerR regulator
MTKEEQTSNGRFIQTGEASRRLGVHPHTVRKWAKMGVIDYFVAPGGRFYYDVDGFIDRVLTKRRAAARNN